jgi:hypothetical protein
VYPTNPKGAPKRERKEGKGSQEAQSENGRSSRVEIRERGGEGGEREGGGGERLEKREK